MSPPFGLRNGRVTGPHNASHEWRDGYLRAIPIRRRLAVWIGRDPDLTFVRVTEEESLDTLRRWNAVRVPSKGLYLGVNRVTGRAYRALPGFNLGYARQTMNWLVDQGVLQPIVYEVDEAGNTVPLMFGSLR